MNNFLCVCRQRKRMKKRQLKMKKLKKKQRKRFVTKHIILCLALMPSFITRFLSVSVACCRAPPSVSCISCIFCPALQIPVFLKNVLYFLYFSVLLSKWIKWLLGYNDFSIFQDGGQLPSWIIKFLSWFEMWTRMCPRNHVRWGLDPQEGAFLEG